MEGQAAPFQRRTVSFVRRENRLGPQLQRTWDEHYGTLVIDVPRARASMSVARGFELDATRDFGRVAPLVVEIGSGTGVAVVQGALSRPGTNFLAVEVYGPGLAATAAKIVHHNLTNVRLVHADAVQVLEHMLRPLSAAELWIFFADPWHKVRHHKRRLVNPAFAELAASRLARGGKLRLATDWADYATQMRDVLSACASLTNPYGGNPGTGFAPRFEGRVVTRFEQKGLASGRRIYDLELQRA
jgi:tRNA (guanine-N7-)-methyltransferase